MQPGKKFFSFLISVLSVVFGSGQLKGQIDSAFLALPAQHYNEEYDFDASTNPNDWLNAKGGLHVAFGSEDNLYFRAEVPGIFDSQTWHASGWKGERLNTQIVVWSPDSLKQIHFVLSDLKNEKGKILSGRTIQLNKVCYVLSNYPYDADSADCGEGATNKAWLMPDRFESFERFDLPAKTVRPVWLSLNIPSDADGGVYTGLIKVASGDKTITLTLKIKIQNQVLPRPADWKFRLDLWQNPWVIADYYHLKPWSEEHKELLKKHLKLYADAGGKYITTYGVHSPWGDNEYYLEEGMIEWIKKKNGTWKFDYNIFDQYVELAMSVGIKKAITIYTPLPWGERFRYFDEANGKYVYERWVATSDSFRKNWNIFLTDLRTHLKQKGWFDKTYLGVNENAMDQTLSAIKVIRDHSRDWKITYAGDWHPQLDTLLTDYCSVFGKEPSVDDVKKRALSLHTSTFYICCTPPKPNTFLFSPPIEGRWLGWYAYAHHYDGFLRWAYDSWPADPLRDARYIYWPAGDCFLIYPGAGSCIRFEKLREGISDYEKIRIIKGLAAKSSDKSVKELMSELESHLEKFNSEQRFNETSLKEDIEKGKKLVDELSERLAAK